MEKLFLENATYICIHYTPSRSVTDAIENLHKASPCREQLTLHHQFHVTLLYAPIITHRHQEAVDRVQESEHPDFPLRLTFSAPQKTPYGTILSSVLPKKNLETLHHYFFSLMEPYIHSVFIDAYACSRIDNAALRFIHTRNLGKNYTPHMTLGYMPEASVGTDFDMQIGSIFPIVSDAAGIFLSDANNATLRPLLSLTCPPPLMRTDQMKVMK